MAMLGASCSKCCEPQPPPECDDCVTGELPETVTVVLSIPSSLPLVEVTLSASFGSGATVTVEGPAGETDEDDFPHGQRGPISAVTLVEPGSGYARLARIAPQMTATGPGGNGAVLPVTMVASGDSFAVGAVGVTNGGSGYTDGGSVTFTPEAGSVTVTAATATVVTRYDPPVATFSVTSAGGGSGATFIQPYFTVFGSFPKAHYKIAGPYLDDFIDSPGTGYAEGDPVTLVVSDGVTVTAFAAAVDLLGPNGEIEGIIITEEGDYYLDDGAIWSVTVTNGGSYHIETVQVATITFTVTQKAPSIGSGLELEATVDEDKDSGTFGEITSVTLVDGGDGFMVSRDIGACMETLNGEPMVLRRQFEANPCAFGVENCLMRVTVGYNGPLSPPSLSVSTPVGQLFGDEVFNTPTLVEDCDEIDLAFNSYTHPLITATVAGGGDYTGELPIRVPANLTATWSSETLDIPEFLYLAGYGAGTECSEYLGSYPITRNDPYVDVGMSCVTTPGFPEYEPEPGTVNPPYVLIAGSNPTPCDVASRNANLWASQAYWIEDRRGGEYLNIHFDCDNTLHELFGVSPVTLLCVGPLDSVIVVSFACPGQGGGNVFLRPPYAGPGACPEKEYKGPTHYIEIEKKTIKACDPFMAVGKKQVFDFGDPHDIIVTVTE